jgi:hypothetical protein
MSGSTLPGLRWMKTEAKPLFLVDFLLGNVEGERFMAVSTAREIRGR